ncbi:flavodoxin reductase [Candidatus Pacearchaeota archaeon]|nr:flavodoxin reductase [Candidatus Pacearchaeota archaeon]
MAKEHIVIIEEIVDVSNNVKRFRLDKPPGFKFIPGHSVMISLPENIKDSHPFSFTSTNDDSYLEFHIKKYNSPGNFTSRLHSLKPGDSLILSDQFGSIRYTKPGLMIAAGQAITPFIAILRQLKRDNSLTGNTLLHSVSRRDDLFLENELKSFLGNNYIIALTKENHPDYLYGRINKTTLRQFLPKNKQSYVIGSDDFVSDIRSFIKEI